ncbi:adenosylcobinamide-GDP ribazoletransferase [Vibrio albus]|uniref:Adenosylcobinamide-GDP ribazoletransferase n=1 Tax=Vibrio albus TaxID=2200953 RepID=A0A2U3B622_9VIBR|nr:adenosylcobinamide-GDP ribazoletransferase [Vibrio albus]PWI32240.1 adenosylcobinamide-GDP ribazoletransferase [Vibrio albus]
MKAFFVTLQFMTRLPVPQSWTHDFDFDDTYKGIVAFPWVGLILGGIAAVITMGATRFLGWDSLLGAAVYVFMMALLTGGFHLDGLADTADGIFSARTPERMLEIMKDSRLGTHGALALFFVLLLKVLVVSQILRQFPESALWILVASPLAGRTLMSLLMYRQHYARESGLGHIYINRISSARLGLTLATGTLLSLFTLGWKGGVGLLVTSLFCFVYRSYINRVIGGQTGDTLGAGNELFELCFLIVMVSVFKV